MSEFAQVTDMGNLTDLPGCPVSCDDDCETDCHALHQPRWTQIRLARDCRERACPARSGDEPLRHDLDPCPGGCGELTDDPYGGPCTRCWNALGSTL
jgi:hypothetical protein